MKISHRNKKGMELSINMLVIVAMAVFVLFLVVGFVLGGFGYFKNLFGVTKTSPEQAISLKCGIDLQNYINQYGRTTSGPKTSIAKLCDERTEAGFDANGDGVYDPTTDTFKCSQSVDTSGICT